ncbi:MAG TPA: AMP-dependent synthetase, partial [Acidimicrobiales bacterium]|nr:AMP-dependent synthetase [Acidimicrobiales bacterium]
VVQLRAGQEAGGDEIIGICRENLGGYKKPKAVYFVDELPKNAAGKIHKRELRRMVVDEELT